MCQEGKECGAQDCISEEDYSGLIEEGIVMLWRHQDCVPTTNQCLGIKGIYLVLVDSTSQTLEKTLTQS